MKVKKSSLPSYDSVMKMGYTRYQAEDSLRIYVRLKQKIHNNSYNFLHKSSYDHIFDVLI